MNPTNSPRESLLSEEEIDRQVEAEANDDSAWDAPVFVRQEATAISIPGDLAAKATFLAGLHHEENVEAWIVRLIRERVELEEAAFLAVKGAFEKRC